MSVATSLIEESSARIASAPAETLYQFNESPLLARQSQQESNARSYPRRIPLALKRAKGLYVEDVEGRTFIDCLAGAGTLALGHNHPVVIEAIQQVLADELPLHTLDLTTPVKDQFVQDLFGLLPPALAKEAKIQFCGPTGTDAVEAALKLVRTATGRSTVLSFSGGYHGMSQGALSLMGSLGPKKPLGALLSNGVQFMPFPYDYRCPFGLGGAEGVKVNLHYLENLLNDPEAGVALPAAVIVEAVQGEGGVIPADIEWLRGLRRITEKAGVALIVDEIQSGFARTGKQLQRTVGRTRQLLGQVLPLGVHGFAGIALDRLLTQSRVCQRTAEAQKTFHGAISIRRNAQIAERVSRAVTHTQQEHRNPIPQINGQHVIVELPGLPRLVPQLVAEAGTHVAQGFGVFVLVGRTHLRIQRSGEVHATYIGLATRFFAQVFDVDHPQAGVLHRQIVTRRTA